MNLEDPHPAELHPAGLDQVVCDQLEEALEIGAAGSNGEVELSGERVGEFLLGPSHGKMSSGRV